MEPLDPGPYIKLAMAFYAAGALISLLAIRREKIANAAGFGCATLAGLSGVVGAVIALWPAEHKATFAFRLWSWLIPGISLEGRLDPLGAFFVLILSLLALAISIYSLGYARGYYGRKSSGFWPHFTTRYCSRRCWFSWPTTRSSS